MRDNPGDGEVSGNSFHYYVLATVLPRPKEPWGKCHTHLRRPKMKAWKRLRLLLKGASRLTWLYRDPIECVQEPEDRGKGQPGPGPTPIGFHSLTAHLVSQMPPPRSKGYSYAVQ